MLLEIETALEVVGEKTKTIKNSDRLEHTRPTREAEFNCQRDGGLRKYIKTQFELNWYTHLQSLIRVDVFRVNLVLIGRFGGSSIFTYLRHGVHYLSSYLFRSDLLYYLILMSI